MATAKCELAVPVKEQKILDKCAARIDKANERFGKDFVSWITEVGECLKTARDTLKQGNEKQCDGWFGGWIKDRLGLSRAYCHRLIDAYEVVDGLQKVLPIGNTFELPRSESTCRELCRVPEDQLPEVWQQYCEHAKEQGIKPTAVDVKRWLKEQHPEWFPQITDYAPDKPAAIHESVNKSFADYVDVLGKLMHESSQSLARKEMLLLLDAVKQYYDGYMEQLA